MEAKTGYEPTQGGTGTNPATVPPFAMPPPGQVQSGQPGQTQPVQWIPTPLTIIGSPPGLESLTQLDQILVHQHIELVEVFTALELQNKYDIKNSLEQKLFFAKEESDFCDRQRKRSSRQFVMHVVNNDKQEVMRVVRPSHQCDGNDTVAVEAPPGHPIGHIRRRSTMCSSYFEVLDARLKTLLKIRDFCCICEGDGNVDFRLMTPDDSQQIGKISKQYTDYIQEHYTKADNFSVVFPMDLDVKVKATLLGAVFLIDFIFFESTPTRSNELQKL
ncbi:Phospholipid scramblase 2 [Holothuria leucospilota]|uniref:Phospholipid scramblase n=1 Tax=Holothuria leucospilota TaxID=206669 RepID=A0A9Q1HKL2_HOLLE|nr:Phospholipid scramblase 2 [Holothuria leucospilota]